MISPFSFERAKRLSLLVLLLFPVDPFSFFPPLALFSFALPLASPSTSPLVFHSRRRERNIFDLCEIEKWTQPEKENEGRKKKDEERLPLSLPPPSVRPLNESGASFPPLPLLLIPSLVSAWECDTPHRSPPEERKRGKKGAYCLYLRTSATLRRLRCSP